MDPRELTRDFEEYLRELIKRHMQRMWTALPVIVNKWDYPTNGKNTVQITPAIMGEQLQDNGTWMAIPMPTLLDVPVHYPGGGSFIMTHPIQENDEGMAIFSTRAIDSWWQNGGQQPRPDYAKGRHHDLSDAMFIPGLNSIPKQVSNISTTTTQCRSRDGTQYIEWASGGRINIVAPGNVYVTGSIYATGEITRGYGGSDQVDLGQHTHGGVQTGSGNTDKPNAGT